MKIVYVPMGEENGANFPHRFDCLSATLPDLHRMEEWCKEQFGNSGWMKPNHYFYFKRKDDAFAFRMRWG